MSTYVNQDGKGYILISFGTIGLGVVLCGEKSGVIQRFELTFDEFHNGYRLSEMQTSFVANALLHIGEKTKITEEAYNWLRFITGECKWSVPLSTQESIVMFLNRVKATVKTRIGVIAPSERAKEYQACGGFDE